MLFDEHLTNAADLLPDWVTMVADLNPCNEAAYGKLSTSCAKRRYSQLTMTATILPFRPASKPARVFDNFDEVLALELPEPLSVSHDLMSATWTAADATAYAEFFRWFGVGVDVTGPPEQLSEAWELLGAEIGSAHGYKTKHPATFLALHKEWSTAQLAYLEACSQGDWQQAAALLPSTPLWLKLQDVLGSALRA